LFIFMSQPCPTPRLCIPCPRFARLTAFASHCQPLPNPRGRAWAGRHGLAVQIVKTMKMRLIRTQKAPQKGLPFISHHVSFPFRLTRISRASVFKL
jgi:hypothetical protein